jgi:hypothetical protein
VEGASGGVTATTADDKARSGQVTIEMVLALFEKTLTAQDKAATAAADNAAALRDLTTQMTNLIGKVDKVIAAQTTQFAAVQGENKWITGLRIITRNWRGVVIFLQFVGILLLALWGQGARPTDFGVELRTNPTAVRVQTGDAADRQDQPSTSHSAKSGGQP